MKNKNLVGNDPRGNNLPDLMGKIDLVGFEVLDAEEIDIVKRIVANYIRKMSNLGDYKEMRLALRQHEHGKTFKHEIDAFAIFSEGKFNAEVTDWNLYAALSSVCEKIMSELEHLSKKEQRHDKKIFK